MIKLDDQRLPGPVVLEAILLRRAAVPGARIDLLEAMPVAEREVVEAGALGAVGGDRVGRVDLLGEQALHAAVREPDA